MKPEQSIVIVNGDTHADPNADPTTVPFASLLAIHGLDDPKPTTFNSIQCLLDAPAGEGITFSLYAVGDADRDSSDPDMCASTTRFYEVASAVALDGEAVTLIKDLAGLQGPFYVRVTAETLSADAELHLIGAQN